jgi:hypothetical protein
MDADGRGGEREPPFEGGAQPVPERPPEVPTGGRTALQTAVIVLAVAAVVAGLLWWLVPALGAR